jgi:aminomethyltransferase
MATPTAEPLATTPLHALHLELGARMVPFAGYDLPVSYPLGVLREHLHCRSAAGLFDVSHMGQVLLRPLSGRVADAAIALEALVPADVAGLAVGRQRYALLTADDGGILDDLMVANRGDALLLVVNAARKAADLHHLRHHLGGACEVLEVADRALIALQGPAAEVALGALVPGVAAMRFMDVTTFGTDWGALWVSRSGYTGEDGFEISVPMASAEGFARALLADGAVAPIGLGARDSLRLEAGLCLYGADIDTGTDPVEAALEWSIGRARRADGARCGGFPGADRILASLRDGPARRRVGLLAEGRAPVRAGAELFGGIGAGGADATTPAGHVTSGAYGPSLAAPVAMGYVRAGSAGADTRLGAGVRGRRLPVRVATLPFLPARVRR